MEMFFCAMLLSSQTYAPDGVGPSCGDTSISRHGCHLTGDPLTRTVSGGIREAGHGTLMMSSAPAARFVRLTSPMRYVPGVSGFGTAAPGLVVGMKDAGYVNSDPGQCVR